jgi:hypothetical protein
LIFWAIGRIEVWHTRAVLRKTHKWGMPARPFIKAKLFACSY